MRLFLLEGFLPPTALGRIRDCWLQLSALQIDTTSSQERSVLRRYSVGILGFFEANRYPRCLKETISPCWGFHLLANSVVPTGASNRIPFGLFIIITGEDYERRDQRNG